MNSLVRQVQWQPLAAILVTSTLAMLAGYLLVPTLLAPGSEAEKVIELPHNPNCNLRKGPCVSELPGGGRVSFAIAPRHIPPLEPLQLAVDLEGIAARKVEVDFSGTDMFMGFNRVSLQEGPAGRFVGEGTLSVCVRRAMEWQASVLIETDEGVLSVPFRFIVIKPGTG